MVNGEWWKNGFPPICGRLVVYKSPNWTDESSFGEAL